MRRHRLFRRFERKQLYIALFLGVVSSGYIWFPTIAQLEIDQKKKEKIEIESSQNSVQKDSIKDTISKEAVETK